MGTSTATSYFEQSGHTIGRTASRHPDRKHTLAVQTINLSEWLVENVRHQDYVVCKMDIEKAEFDVLPALLRNPSVLRLIDELFVECHHRETWDVGPHRYAECLSLYRALMAEGVWTHDYY